MSAVVRVFAATRVSNRSSICSRRVGLEVVVKVPGQEGQQINLSSPVVQDTQHRSQYTTLEAVVETSYCHLRRHKATGGSRQKQQPHSSQPLHVLMQRRNTRDEGQSQDSARSRGDIRSCTHTKEKETQLRAETTTETQGKQKVCPSSSDLQGGAQGQLAFSTKLRPDGRATRPRNMPAEAAAAVVVVVAEAVIAVVIVVVAAQVAALVEIMEGVAAKEALHHENIEKSRQRIHFFNDCQHKFQNSHHFRHKGSTALPPPAGPTLPLLLSAPGPPHCGAP